MNKNLFSYSTIETDKILLDFEVNCQKGLSAKQVEQRLKKHGPNILKIEESTAWQIIIRQFKSAFIYLLFGAMLITSLLGEFVDTLMILVFLVINTTLGFYQEYSSEKTAKFLKKYALSRAKVLRDGKEDIISSDQLVPGDIVELETGDKVPADARVISENKLVVDETILTGESVPVYKQAEVLKKVPTSHYKAANLLFSGTYVLEGSAKAVVLATGKDTAFGQVAKLTAESRKISEFEKGISHFSQFILKLIGVTIFLVFFAHLIIKTGQVSVPDLVIFSAALTVSVIPEALPLVTTFSLSKGARRLARNKVIVKRLSAIEDMGSIEILCSDKTGTLTKNILEVTEVFSQNPEQTIWLANLAAAFELKKKTEPFDIALEKAMNLNQKKKIANAVKIIEEPFDPRSRINGAIVEIRGSEKIAIVRGAFEEVAEICCDLSKEERKRASLWVKSMGRQGRRTLAVAYQELAGEPVIRRKGSFFKQKKFVFSGVVSFADPLKENAYLVVKEAEQLGVRLIILTGDSPEVAGATAKSIGLIDIPEKVVTGDQWRKSDHKQKEKYLEEYSVFARFSPEDKFCVVDLLRRHHTVGFLGEGINDAPALKISGVSLVVNSAADIAREASDIILLQKDLRVIIEGIKEGRRVFANTTKYIKATLASNFGNFFAVAGASLMIEYLPMLPVQILLVNLLSDAPMISISTDRVSSQELQSPKKYEVKEIIVVSIILGMVSMVFDFIFFGLFRGFQSEVLQTNWFIGSILTELVFIFSIREKSFFLNGIRPSASIIWLTILAFFLTIFLPYTNLGQSIFNFAPPAPKHLILIISLVGLYFFVSEAVKLLYYTSVRNNHSSSKNLN